jgi:hypothetical protein
MNEARTTSGHGERAPDHVAGLVEDLLLLAGEVEGMVGDEQAGLIVRDAEVARGSEE